MASFGCTNLTLGDRNCWRGSNKYSGLLTWSIYLTDQTSEVPFFKKAYLNEKNTLLNCATCMASKYKRTDKLKNCWIANTIWVVSSLNGPVSSLMMMVNDKKKIVIKTNIARSALSLSVTNCCPKGLSWRYLVIKNRKLPVDMTIKR